MVAMIRPTLLLKISLDEEIYSDDTVAEIKRSYSYVSPALVDSHETSDVGCENILRFIVKIRKPYWRSSEEGADDLWNEVMLMWLKNIFCKTSTAITGFNAIREEKNEPSLDYSWAEIELGEESLIALRLGAGSSIPEHAVSLIVSVREVVNDGVLDDPAIACIRIPSRLSLQAIGKGRIEKKDKVDDDLEAEQSENNEATEELVNEEVSASIDYSIWGIEYRDGMIREFDAGERSFME